MDLWKEKTDKEKKTPTFAESNSTCDKYGWFKNNWDDTRSLKLQGGWPNKLTTDDDDPDEWNIETSRK